MFEACHMLWRRQHMSSFLREVTFEFLILENFGNQGLWAYFDFWAWERAACHFCSTCCYYVSVCCACQSSRFFVLAYFHPPHSLTSWGLNSQHWILSRTTWHAVMSPSSPLSHQPPNTLYIPLPEKRALSGLSGLWSEEIKGALSPASLLSPLW